MGITQPDHARRNTQQASARGYQDQALQARLGSARSGSSLGDWRLRQLRIVNLIRLSKVELKSLGVSEARGGVTEPVAIHLVSLPLVQVCGHSWELYFTIEILNNIALRGPLRLSRRRPWCRRLLGGVLCRLLACAYGEPYSGRRPDAVRVPTQLRYAVICALL
jgi:hypothetical protein